MWDWAAVRGVRLLNCSFSIHSVQFPPSATPCTKISSMISWYTKQLEAQKRKETGSFCLLLCHWLELGQVARHHYKGCWGM